MYDEIKNKRLNFISIFKYSFDFIKNNLGTFIFLILLGVILDLSYKYLYTNVYPELYVEYLYGNSDNLLNGIMTFLFLCLLLFIIRISTYTLLKIKFKYTVENIYIDKNVFFKDILKIIFKVIMCLMFGFIYILTYGFLISILFSILDIFLNLTNYMFITIVTLIFIILGIFLWLKLFFISNGPILLSGNSFNIFKETINISRNNKKYIFLWILILIIIDFILILIQNTAFIKLDNNFVFIIESIISKIAAIYLSLCNFILFYNIYYLFKKEN